MPETNFCKTLKKSRKPNEFHVDNWSDYLSHSKKSFDKKSNESWKCQCKIEDFDLIQTLKVGGFSEVILGKKKSNKVLYAVTAIDKKRLVELNAIKFLRDQKRIQGSINFPFCHRLEYIFQDNCYVYICEGFSNGGLLDNHLKQWGKFPERISCFIGAQCVLALEYLHYMGVVYRTLEPEHLVLTSTGYLKLINFDLCISDISRTYTICGYPQYMSPEMLRSVGYGKSIDWWQLGVLLYELNSGTTPFEGENSTEIFENILDCKYNIPDDFSEDLQGLVTKLLEKDISKRYGNLKKGADDIKSHSWFKDINWLSLVNQKVKATFIPRVVGPNDLSQYTVLKERLLETSDQPMYEKYFEDF